LFCDFTQYIAYEQFGVLLVNIIVYY